MRDKRHEQKLKPTGGMKEPTPQHAIATLERDLQAAHTQLRALLSQEGRGALHQHGVKTRLAMLYAKELADARGVEFARFLPVPHLPVRMPPQNRLEVGHRRDGSLEITYLPSAFIEGWWSKRVDVDEDAYWRFLSPAWLRFKNVLAFEQTKPADVISHTFPYPPPEIFDNDALRLGEHYGGFCWEIENSQFVRTVLKQQKPATRHRLNGRLRHWLVRIEPYKFQIVGTSLEFPTTPVKRRESGNLRPR